MKSIAIIYDSFPHYRSGIINALNKSKYFNYYFYGSSISRDASINTFNFERNFKFKDIKNIQIGPFVFQVNLFHQLLKSNHCHFIILGNPYFLSSWLIAIAIKIKGSKIYFWSHGWLSEYESIYKRFFRNIFFRLADGIFLYGERAKRIGINQGFKEDTLYVINNSLDYDLQKDIFTHVKKLDRVSLCNELGLSTSKRIVICSARLTPKCRFDLLLNATNLIQNSTNIALQVVLIGDGVEKQNLSDLADSLQLDVVFWGSCYDETTLCKLYAVSDLAVSPGKVGLTAMHSMAYGTPVISHNNLDNQMPEVEAIISDVTGYLFKENCSKDLAEVIQHWFNTHPHKPVEACVQQIEKFYTPEFQRTVIESVLMRYS
ncbi:glycosyltransferase [Methylomonas sp. LL1]|uniref:glycosyltransferase n=1 Tax=Methylomonas sp. LL1 TaxID=2785785 RepID=UPI0018C43A0D|nr:glycosyltransferase [Methylomonas sp. LL1]QPK62726.1 glycosyltransferase [Methylomonas sp. LL1]